MDINSALNILKPRTWKHPKDYGGFSPDGDYVIYVQNRDSPILDQSNYARIFENLSVLLYPEDLDEPPVYDWRAGHWACGWVEYLMVRKDAPEATLIAAAEVLAALDDYPIYDESDYSKRQYEAMWSYWKQCSIKERVEYCQKARVNIFAARHDDTIPKQVECDLMDEFN